jgi:hypothetical protein
LAKLWAQVGSIPSHTLQQTKMLSIKGTNRMLDMVKYEINVEMSSGYYMYRQFKRWKSLRSAHGVYIAILCVSQNRQRSFPSTELTVFITQAECLLLGTS